MSWYCLTCGSSDREGHEECKRVEAIESSNAELKKSIDELKEKIDQLLEHLRGKNG